MKTMYHVASPEYLMGDDLYCASRLMDMGYSIASKWDSGELYDTDVVCLFESRDAAEDFRAEYQPEGILLAVSIDDEDPEIRLTTVEEGYPAVFGRIPAEYLAAA